MGKRQYSDNDKATALAALDANGGNVNRTAKELGMPRITLKEWADGRVNADVSDIRQEKRLELSELLDNEIRAIFEQMPKKRSEAFYSSLATAAAILIDKKQLLAGKATERKELTGKDGGAIETNVTVFTGMSDDELDNIIAGRATSEGRESPPSDTA